MPRFSKNNKLNSVLSAIYDDLTEMGYEQIKQYVDAFPRETDFNIIQYGNLLVYYSQVRNLYTECGYKTSNYTDYQLWDAYKRQCGYIVRNYFI